MRGGEETIKIFFDRAPKEFNVTMITSNTVDIRAQHWLIGKTLRPNISVISDTKKIVYLRTEPVISTVSNAFHFPTSYVLRRLNMRPYSHVLLDKARIYGWGPYTPAIDRVIKNGKFAVLHGSTFPTTISYLGFLAARKYGVPFVYSPYYHFRIDKYSESSMLRVMLNSSSLVIANTESELRKLVEIGAKPEKITVVPPPFYKDKSKEYFISKDDAKLSFDLSGYYVVLAHPWIGKGIEMVMRALSNVSSNSKRVALLTLGDTGYLYRSLKRKFSSKFVIVDTGWASEAKKWKAFYACDIFAMPSLNDSFGLSFLNAWATKRPIIGVRNTSAEDIITNGKDGFLIDYGNVRELSEVINYSIENGQSVEKMGEVGYGNLAKMYDPIKVSNQFFNALISSIT
jgi:glycosyltransferase involved in cell wall biosynthesis